MGNERSDKKQEIYLYPMKIDQEQIVNKQTRGKKSLKLC